MNPSLNYFIGLPPKRKVSCSWLKEDASSAILVLFNRYLYGILRK